MSDYQTGKPVRPKVLWSKINLLTLFSYHILIQTMIQQLTPDNMQVRNIVLLPFFIPSLCVVGPVGNGSTYLLIPLM